MLHNRLLGREGRASKGRLVDQLRVAALRHQIEIGDAVTEDHVDLFKRGVVIVCRRKNFVNALLCAPIDLGCHTGQQIARIALEQNPSVFVGPLGPLSDLTDSRETNISGRNVAVFIDRDSKISKELVLCLRSNVRLCLIDLGININDRCAHRSQIFIERLDTGTGGLDLRFHDLELFNDRRYRRDDILEQCPRSAEGCRRVSDLVEEFINLIFSHILDFGDALPADIQIKEVIEDRLQLDTTPFQNIGQLGDAEIEVVAGLVERLDQLSVLAQILVNRLNQLIKDYELVLKICAFAFAARLCAEVENAGECWAISVFGGDRVGGSVAIN